MRRTHDHDEMVRLYAEGLGARLIAQRLGCEFSTVRETLIRRGVKMRPPLRRDVQQETEAIRLVFERGATPAEAAERLGRSPNTVRRWVRVHRAALAERRARIDTAVRLFPGYWAGWLRHCGVERAA